MASRSDGLMSALSRMLDMLAPFYALIARVWVSWIFFSAGLLKITSWQTTLMLFQSEFQVPLLPSGLAAVLGTGAELVLTVLVLLGLGGRFSVLGLFVYNAIAVLSYPHLWTPAGTEGLIDHINWGMILGLLMCYGHGKWSLDYWLSKHYDWPAK